MAIQTEELTIFDSKEQRKNDGRLLKWFVSSITVVFTFIFGILLAEAIVLAVFISRL